MRLCKSESQRTLVPRYFSVAVAATVGFLLISQSSMAQTAMKSLNWGPAGSPYRIAAFECAKEGVGTILIDGIIVLEHPEDKPDVASPPEIYLHCDNFMFGKDSKVFVKSALYIRGEKSIGGAIDIENTRGGAGADAPVDRNLYNRTKAINGDDGRRGNDGDGAVVSSDKYPFGKNADNGSEGEAGGRGADGIVGAPASDGRLGSAAAPITVKARTYLGGTTVILTAKGGGGSKGVDGGTGQDGGDGGVGGIGGRGGNSAAGRSAGNGGRGGAGGDGGNGGWGGKGGDGGNGGRGGDAKLLIIGDDKGNHGNPPSDWTSNLDGGKGGTPGLGGAPGRGGKGRPGGFGGCGGSGTNLIILYHPDGNCGAQGSHGKDGVDGQPGPAGQWGKDGDPGKFGDWTIGIVVETGGH